MNATIEQTPVDRPRQFPPFSLSRLLRTVFDPKAGERVCILIDLEDPREIAGFRCLQNPDLSIQRHAHDVFYQGLRNGVMNEMGLTGGEMFAYEITGGSNLDLPTKGFATDGREIDLVEDVYKSLRSRPVHLHLLGHRTTDGFCQAVRLPWRDHARHEPGDSEFRAGGRLFLGQQSGGEAAARDDAGGLGGDRLRGSASSISRCISISASRRHKKATACAAADPTSRTFRPAKFITCLRARPGSFRTNMKTALSA